MSSSQPEHENRTTREQHQRRMRRIPGAIFAACMGLVSFFNVAGNARFESYHTLDVIRLMIAGAAIPVTIMLLINIFNVFGPTSKI